MKPEINAPADSSSNPDVEVIGLTDIVRMILRHRLKITVFTVLVTTFAAVIFSFSPRQYQAEGLLQVIPPVSSIDEKIDRDLFETFIISRLQTVQSAFIAKEVCAAINTGAVAMTVAELQDHVKITRPPKSNLIIITATAVSPQRAIAIVTLWIQKYLKSMLKNNVSSALTQVRSMLKKAQSELMEAQAKCDQMKKLAAQTKPTVDLLRGIDDSQLWRSLAENTPPDKLKRLSDIQIRGQEQNEEYVTVKTMFFNADQSLAMANANCGFLQEVERYLESKSRRMENASADTANASSNAVQFAETLIKSTDVITVGEPAVKSSSRGALRKTVIAFFTSLLAASLCAYLAEWLKIIKV